MRPVDPRLLRRDPSVVRHLAGTAVLGIGLGLLLVAQATLLARVIARVFLDGAAPAAVWGDLLALAGVVALRAAVVGGREALGRRTAGRVIGRLRGDLLAHTARAGPVALSSRSRGELTATATTGLDALEPYLAGYLPQLVLAVVVPVVILARLVPVDLTAVAIMAVTLPLIPAFMALVGLATEASTARRWRTLTRLSAHFLDVVDGLPTLRAFGRSRHQIQVLAAVGDDYRRATMATLRWSFLSALVLELLATMGVALVAVAVGLRVVDGGLALEPALTVLVLAPEVYLPLRQVGARFHQAMDGVEAAGAALATLERPVPGPPPATAVAAPDLRTAAIQFIHVGFTYPELRDAALSGVTAEVRPGDLVQIVGPSGAGKTTLAALLLGFAHPTAGRITVGDPALDLGAVDLASWHRQIAWVPQRPFVATASVADNVRLGRPDASDEDVRAALAAADLRDDVDRLPAGPATVLAEDGRSLSAGQRRRLALSRAFLRAPALVIVDEPTADLDPATAERVLASLAALAATSTLVVVAHRPVLPGGMVLSLDGAGRAAAA